MIALIKDDNGKEQVVKIENDCINKSTVKIIYDNKVIRNVNRASLAEMIIEIAE